MNKFILLSLCFFGACASTTNAQKYLSPEYMDFDPARKLLYVTASSASKIMIINTSGDGTLSSEIELPANPNGIAVGGDGAIFAAVGGFDGRLLRIVDGKICADVGIGHTPLAPVISPDGKTLYAACRFDNMIVSLDAVSMERKAEIGVSREPHALAFGAGGKLLFVANHLPDVRATDDVVSANVSIIDTTTDKVVRNVRLPNGSSGVRGICATPDGAVIYITHTLARFQLPTTQLERGWMNTAGLSVFDGTSGNYINTVLLDDVDLGAANPWGVAVSPCTEYLFVAHAGTSEISMIDRLALHQRLSKAEKGEKVTEVTSSPESVPNDLSFVVPIRRRIKIPGDGVRGVAVTGDQLFVSLYFKDTLARLDFRKPRLPLTEIALGPAVDLSGDRVRRGEMLWNDGTMCFQHWQSCASCHPDGRADALNWDLLNDGIGNPKQTKSLVYCHLTPPTMVTGIRPDMETCNRKGLTHIQFVVRPEEDALCLDAYVRSLKPLPSPYLVKRRSWMGLGNQKLTLSDRAREGEKIFRQVGCAECHPPTSCGPEGEKLFSNLRKYDLGLGVGNEKNRSFDTTHLVEVWRTSPYLYDGRALTITEMFTKCNPEDRHGETGGLNPNQIEVLAEYILSY
jgi:DNA-binding beta-propeller fold protein YncE